MVVAPPGAGGCAGGLNQCAYWLFSVLSSCACPGRRRRLRRRRRSGLDTVVITRLDYSKGDAKPTFAQMAFTLPPTWSPSFTDAMAQETIADFQRLLAPEFAVDGRMERLRAGPTFFFIITEGEPRAGGEAARQMETVREE